MKPPQWRCAKCLRTFSTWTGRDGAQTHANDSGHARIESLAATPEAASVVSALEGVG